MKPSHRPRGARASSPSAAPLPPTPPLPASRVRPSCGLDPVCVHTAEDSAVLGWNWQPAARSTRPFHRPHAVGRQGRRGAPAPSLPDARLRVTPVGPSQEPRAWRRNAMRAPPPAAAAAAAAAGARHTRRIVRAGRPLLLPLAAPQVCRTAEARVEPTKPSRCGTAPRASTHVGLAAHRRRRRARAPSCRHGDPPPATTSPRPRWRRRRRRRRARRPPPTRLTLLACAAARRPEEGAVRGRPVCGRRRRRRRRRRSDGARRCGAV